MSRNIWFISDTHFQHANIVKFSPDPDLFTTVEERDELIIERWNSVVKAGDKVYHLGDVGFGNKKNLPNILNRLNGSKRLVVGNHDDVKFWAAGGCFQKIMLWRIWHDKNIIFTHVPIHQDSIIERLQTDQGINVHGHTHLAGSPEGPYRSVTVELNNYTPVHLEEL